MHSRRQFLQEAAAFGLATGVLGASVPGLRAEESQPLRIPELIDARREGQSISLAVRAGETAFFPGVHSRTLGYNESGYLGPTLRVHRGDEVAVAATNSLRSPTTVHWHGLLIPSVVDGGPHQEIAPGATWRPVLPIRQPAATLMYHSHAHGLTAEQVYHGLVGVLIVTDKREQQLGLPSDYGVNDLPLVLQDRSFDAQGRLVYPTNMMAAMMGVRGEALLVNGTVNAVARVPRGLVRLRLVNASNARVWDLSFADRRAFHWIASDGGLLERPVQRTSLRLGSGERAEVLVDFSDGRAVALQTGPDPNATMGMGMMGRIMGGARRLLPFADEPETVLHFEPSGAPSSAGAIPQMLVPQERVDPAQAVRRREVTLTMGMGGMMGRGMMGGGMMRGGGMMGGLAINGRPFDMQRVDERVGLGDAEIWEASGDMFEHPLHIHGVHFRVLKRNGAAPGVEDQGLKDTVLIREPTELLVQFTQPATREPFVYHCHILEHEDNGMMAQYQTG